MAREFSKPFYRSKQWQQIREYIIKRDKYKCVQCGMPAEEVHHIIWLSPKNIGDPNITSHENNLISLCRDCHMSIHKKQKIEAVVKAHTKNSIDNEYYFDDKGYLIKKDIPPTIL